MKLEKGLASFNHYSITLIGSTGVISRSILKALKAKNISFNLVDLSRTKNIKNRNDLYTFLDEYLYGKSIGIIINTVASLHPKTESDIYINQELPLHLLEYRGNKCEHLIHLSTINVLLKELKDEYTIQKRISENLLNNSTLKNYFIYRLPLIIPKQSIRDGIIPTQYKLINFFISLPFFGIVPPSRNIYKPLDSEEIVEIILKDIPKKDKKINCKIINLNGSQKMNLHKLSIILLKLQSKKNKLICLNPKFIFKILDFHLKKYPFLKNYFERNVFLQQFLPIKRF